MDGRIIAERFDEGVGQLTISRPDKRNAMTAAMIDDFVAGFEEFSEDDAISVIVLTGAGDKAFCAGHDIKDIPEGDLSHLFGEEHMQPFLLPRHSTKPVISAVNGSAYAGGFCLALASDFRIATPEASFAVPGPRLGIVPIAGQSARLIRMLPQVIVNEMIMAGRPLSATSAEHFGFINAVGTQDGLIDAAMELARDIAGMSQFSVRSFKRISQSSLFGGVETADAMEYWLATEAGHGDDVKEGLTAFAEKRAPNFRRNKARS